MMGLLGWIRDHRFLGVLLLLPVMAIVLAPPLAMLLPSDAVWAAALEAVLLASGPWSMLLWIALSVVLVVRQKRRGLGLLLGIAGFAGLGWPLSPSGEGLLLISANVQAFSDGRVELERALAEEEADVVLLIEKRAEEIEGLVRVGDNFRADLPKASHGMAFFCREGLDCRTWISGEIGGEEACSMPLGLLRIEEKLCVVGIHVPPPVPFCATGRGPYIEWVARKLQEGRLLEHLGPCRKGDPVIAIGDFNATQGSRTLRSFTQRGFRDPQRYRGIYASSWPAGGGWPNFPVFRLDHVLVGDVEIDAVQQFRLPKADHKALRVWVKGLSGL